MKKITIITTLFCLAILAGCAQHLGREVNTDAVSKIVKGQTTRDEVVAWFGPATNVTINGDGKEILQWSFLEVKTGARSYIPFAGAKQDVRQQNLVITLNKEKVVEDFQLSQGTPNMGGPR